MHETLVAKDSFKRGFSLSPYDSPIWSSVQMMAVFITEYGRLSGGAEVASFRL
jgi:hypothetical protein